MLEAGFKGIRKAVTRRQNKVTQYIATRTNLDLCERAMQRVGVRVSRRWWDQEEIDMKVARERAAEALATDSELESEVEYKSEVETEPEVGEEERSTSIGVSGASDDPWG